MNDDEKVKALINRGEECINKGDNNNAIIFFREALDILKRDYTYSIKSDIVHCYTSLGIAYTRMDKKKEAVKCFEKALLLRLKLQSN